MAASTRSRRSLLARLGMPVYTRNSSPWSSAVNHVLSGKCRVAALPAGRGSRLACTHVITGCELAVVCAERKPSGGCHGGPPTGAHVTASEEHALSRCRLCAAVLCRCLCEKGWVLCHAYSLRATASLDGGGSNQLGGKSSSASVLARDMYSHSSSVHCLTAPPTHVNLLQALPLQKLVGQERAMGLSASCKRKLCTGGQARHEEAVALCYGHRWP